MKAANVIRTVADNAKNSFIYRDDAIDAIASCILSAQHVLLLGKPGTAKSALVTYFAKSTQLTYWETLLNPDLLRDDIYGPIDPQKFAQGEWDRKWTGLAKAHLAFGDEVGKASGQVLNLFLKAMEERKATMGGTVVDLPLITFVGASNELFEGESQAVWDRFLARIVVNPIPTNQASQFQQMLVAKVEPVPQPLDIADLIACNLQAKRMAANPSQDVITTLTQLWTHLETVTPSYVSDRRWRRTLSLAAGKALLDGCDEIRPHHLAVAKWTLWSDPAEIDTLAAWIDGIVDSAARELNEAKKKLADLVKAHQRAGADLNQLAEVNMRIDRLTRDLLTKSGSEWAQLRADVAQLKAQIV